MAIPPGTRLGAFEVVSTLGVGGMGEVYRATDTRLKRQVAIKILPPSVAMDAERLSRFEREAELLASLNHPNIAAVFGIEDTSAGKAIVMELVEGSDLRDRIARGVPPLAEAIAIATQLARAMEAAHDRGIIHRDLKPGNIRLRDDGTVKVLDFGLAKAIAKDDPHDATASVTRDGVIMGTPRYMSPEQARGESAGPPTDIWAFGVILYEVLTGIGPFDAPTSTEVLARVLHEEPDFSRLPPQLPPPIALLVRRCLRKLPQQRLRHIGDAAMDLAEATSSPHEVAPAPQRRHHWMTAITAVAIVASIGIAGRSWVTGSADPTERLVRVEVSAPSGGNFFPVGVRRVAMSADGQRIAIATRTGIYIRRLDEADFVIIPSAAANPFFSPDGQSIAYFDTSERGTGLMVAPVAGGPSKLLVPVADRSAGGDWRADGTIVFATTGGISVVRDDGTQLRTVARPDPAAQQRILAWPEFLPDGNAALVTVAPMDGAAAYVARINLDTSAMDIVLRGASAARYVPGGRLVYASRDRLMTVPLDPRRPSIAPDSAVDTNIDIVVAADNGAADFALSDGGDLIYLPPSSRLQLTSRLFWKDRQGREENIELPMPRFAYPRISPDGTRIVMDGWGTGLRDIWIYDTRLKRASQLSSSPTEDMMPLWSRDGRRVFFASDRMGNFDIYSRAADGSGQDQLEYAGKALDFPTSFTPDGAGLLILEDYVNVSLLRRPGSPPAEPVLHSPVTERLAELSPDGKWIAYESNEGGGGIEVVVRSFPDVNARREQISVAGGRFPLWNPSRIGELFFVSADGEMMAVMLSPTLAIRSMTKLFDAQRPGGVSGRPWDFSARDDRFLLTAPQITGDTATTNTTLILNWTASLKN